jgi:hypothetical protein
MTGGPVASGLVDVFGPYLSLASFQSPPRFVPSAWFEHAPFGSWLIEAHRPACLVELGTHYGFSYGVFCEAVRRAGLGTRCHAVDTWRGDEHAGFYGEDVLEGLRQFHDPRYGGFSRLLHLTFDEAAREFPDGSIDLLHVDGRHFYEDVRHDYLTWQPKLSDRAVVLFHDTDVRERNFGVYRFWAELAGQRPHFEFKHGNGLGVLGHGRSFLPPVQGLFAAADDAESTAAIRFAYASLGRAIADRWQLLRARAKLRSRQAQAPHG